MVDFDLRELSAPLEELRPEVQAAYKRLDAQWDAVSNALKKLPIPCNVGFTYEGEDHGNYRLNLEWRKWKGKKRICIVEWVFGCTPYGPEESETVTPYDEWSGEQRIQMLEYVPQLFEAAAKRTKEFIAKTMGKDDAADGVAR